MRRCFWKFWQDEAGVVLSAELVLILTIVVLGVIVGLVQVRTAVVTELHDISLAMSHLNQSYAFTGFRGCAKWWGGRTSYTAGSSFYDVYDGTNTLAVTDVGASYAGPGSLLLAPGAYGFGARGAGVSVSAYGTIVLADGTLVPLSWVAAGTWALPGGGLLAATTANSNFLILADGSQIPFVFGAPGTVAYANGTVVPAWPGALGTVVLSNGAVVTLAAGNTGAGTLADGTAVTFSMVDLNSVVLGNGSTLGARSGAAGTLVLADGRVIRLNTAIVPAGAVLNRGLGGGGFGPGASGAGASGTGGPLASRGTIVLADGTLIPLSGKGAGIWGLPGGETLAAVAANSNLLTLADGIRIPFVFGAAGIITYADGTVAAVRPGAAGTVVLADGTVISLNASQRGTVQLPDGTSVTLTLADPERVLLSNGSAIEVKSYSAGQLVLADDRVINLRDAVLPKGAAVIPVYPVNPYGSDVPAVPVQPGRTGFFYHEPVEYPVLPPGPLPAYGAGRYEALQGHPSFIPEGHFPHPVDDQIYNSPREGRYEVVPSVPRSVPAAPPVNRQHPCCPDQGSLPGRVTTTPVPRPEVPWGPVPQGRPQF